MGNLLPYPSPYGSVGVPQELDLVLMELFLQFFSPEELVEQFTITDLDTKELTILKAAVLQELYRQLATSPIRDAVRIRWQQVYDKLRPPASQAPSPP